MTRAIRTVMLLELSFYKAMAVKGGHGFPDPMDYDPLDSDFAPDDEDLSKASGKKARGRGRGRPRGRGRRGSAM